MIYYNSATYEPSDIHLDGCNFAFVDGHVKWMKSEPVKASWGTANSLWDLQ